jgi:hypothetical protein
MKFKNRNIRILVIVLTVVAAILLITSLFLDDENKLTKLIRVSGYVLILIITLLRIFFGDTTKWFGKRPLAEESLENKTGDKNP